MYNIQSYGAVADGVTLNTTAIQAAIDACAASGGGCVTVPTGTYKTGTIWLRSGVELHLESGAVLLASDDLDDYNELDAYEQNFGCPVTEKWVGKHLIIAHEVENVAITGFGTVNGNCNAFVDYVDVPPRYGWRSGTSRCKDPEKLRPGQLIVFIECRHVTVHDITVVDSPCWSLFFHGCEYVQVRGYKAFNPINMLNSDGMDIDTCRYVTVSDCIIRTGDDAITLRCDENRVKNKNLHCEFVTITGCVLHTGICAFRIGVGTGHIRHVQISNITIERCLNILEFCTAYSERGCANIEDIHVSGISAVDTDRAIRMFANNNAVIRDVSLENIRATSKTMNYIDCESGTIDNIKLRDVEITVSDRYTKDQISADQFAYRGSHLFKVHNASRVVLDGLKIYGSLCGCDGDYAFTECPDLVRRDCNF